MQIIFFVLSMIVVIALITIYRSGAERQSLFLLFGAAVSVSIIIIFANTIFHIWGTVLLGSILIISTYIMIRGKILEVSQEESLDEIEPVDVRVNRINDQYKQKGSSFLSEQNTASKKESVKEPERVSFNQLKVNNEAFDIEEEWFSERTLPDAQQEDKNPIHITEVEDRLEAIFEEEEEKSNENKVIEYVTAPEQEKTEVEDYEIAEINVDVPQRRMR
ncbi:hypothetical protein LF817_03855 [Halobacillus sp. A1]|uniref:hypothetical protein n=1 Tax=Halobacillus sp. A1 TaxID=2880262 RepID=UPI0020A6C9CE|nr:hypothetical protein [Halobacillus sp. A1]MCP3030468.1 hypothetical protein [Halobacillus sp. A1]